MSSTPITVTEAARRFADCVNRAYYQNTTFVLLKNGVPVAQLGPPTKRVCRGADLAAALRSAELPRKEALAWRRDLRKARRKLKAPVDKWRSS